MRPRFEVVIINGRKVQGAVDPSLAFRGAELWTNGRHIEPSWQWTAHFDMHPIEGSAFHPGIKRDRPHAWNWYCAQDRSRPIYLAERSDACPAGVVFPRRDVQLWAAQWGSESEFRTSVDWMLAFAGYGGARRVILHNVGVQVSNNAAWLAQHAPGIAYWIAALRFLNVKVEVQGPSVFAPPALVYGYEHGGARHGYRLARRVQR